MEHSTSVPMNIAQAGAERNFRAEMHLLPLLEMVDMPAPSAPRRAILRAHFNCAALILTALVVGAAYILIPLAMALHVAMHPVLLAVGIAATVLTAVALVVKFIILKTEGPAE